MAEFHLAASVPGSCPRLLTVTLNGMAPSLMLLITPVPQCERGPRAQLGNDTGCLTFFCYGLSP